MPGSCRDVRPCGNLANSSLTSGVFLEACLCAGHPRGVNRVNSREPGWFCHGEFHTGRGRLALDETSFIVMAGLVPAIRSAV